MYLQASGDFALPPCVFDCDNCGHCDNRMDIGFACPQSVRSCLWTADKFNPSTCGKVQRQRCPISERPAVHQIVHFSPAQPLVTARGLNYPVEEVRQEYLWAGSTPNDMAPHAMRPASSPGSPSPFPLGAARKETFAPPPPGGPGYHGLTPCGRPHGAKPGYRSREKMAEVSL